MARKATKKDELTGDVAKTYQRFLNYSEYWNRFIERGIEAIQFYGGDQWSIEDQALFQSRRRPIVTINRIASLVRQVTGMRVKERLQPRVSPEREGTVDSAILMTKLLYFLLKKSDYQQINHAVNEDQVVTGRGWFEVYVDKQKDPRGQLKVGHAEWNEIFPDPDARRLYYEDGREMFRIRYLNKETIQELFSTGDDLTDNQLMHFHDDDDRVTKKMHDQFIDGNGNYMVLQRHYFKKISKHEITDGTTWREIPRRMPEEIAQAVFGPMTAQATTSKRELWVETYIPAINADKSINHAPYAIQTGHYPFVPAICYLAGNKLMGIVEDLKDEQRRTNKSFSQIIEILGYSAKGLWLSPKGSVDKDEFEENVARPGGIVEYDGTRAPEYVDTAKLPQGYAQLYDASEKNFQLISGIVPALEGKSEFAGESGIKFAQKLAQAREQLAVIDRHFIDSFNRVCKIMLKGIPQVYDYEFVFRALEGNDQYQDITVNKMTMDGILNDLSDPNVEYDVDVEQTQETSTIRQAGLEEMARTMAAVGPQWAGLLVAEWIRGTDIEKKNELAQRIELLSGQAMQLEAAKTQLAAMNAQRGQQLAGQRNEQQQQQNQIKGAKTAAEIEKMKSDTQRADQDSKVENVAKIAEMLYQGGPTAGVLQ